MISPLSIFRKFIHPIRRKKGKEEVLLFKGRSKFRTLTIIENTKKHTRIMYTGNRLFVAGIDTKNGFPLYLPYFLADIVNPHPRSLLFLGGGPNAVPSYLWRKYKPKSIHVVEHDELNTHLAQKYFNLPKERKYQIFHQDATSFLKETKKKYETIYMNIGLTRKRGLSKKDLYFLCTLSGIKNLRGHLTKTGLLMYIIIGKLEGKDLIFERKCLSSLNEVFPKIYVFSDFQKKRHKMQLILFLATAKKTDIKKRYFMLKAKKRLPQPVSLYENLLAKMHIHPIIKPNLKPYL